VAGRGDPGAAANEVPSAAQGGSRQSRNKTQTHDAQFIRQPEQRFSLPQVRLLVSQTLLPPTT